MNKRQFLRNIATLGFATITFPQLFAKGKAKNTQDFSTLPLRTQDFSLPELPYKYEALEPHIDKLTMEIHHSKHHAGYIKNLNEALKDKRNIQWEKAPIEKILAELTYKASPIRNNAGGHYNHSLFWTLLSPKGGGLPSGKLAEAINTDFGSFDKFKEDFQKQASMRFGSGWAWLIKTKEGKLSVCSTANQDNPLMETIAKDKDKGKPILALDVWEHAYYLHYQNRRIEYIKAFWSIVNWTEANKRFEEA